MTPDQKPSPRERGPYRDSRASGASSAAATRGNSSAMPNPASTRTATKRSGSVPRPTPPTTSATPTIVIVNVAESRRTTPSGRRRPPAPPADSTAGRTGSTHGLSAVPAPARNAKASRITMPERTVAVRRARFAGSPGTAVARKAVVGEHRAGGAQDGLPHAVRELIRHVLPLLGRPRAADPFGGDLGPTLPDLLSVSDADDRRARDPPGRVHRRAAEDRLDPHRRPRLGGAPPGRRGCPSPSRSPRWPRRRRGGARADARGRGRPPDAPRS